jgi:hypothetical protein
MFGPLPDGSHANALRAAVIGAYYSPQGRLAARDLLIEPRTQIGLGKRLYTGQC